MGDVFKEQIVKRKPTAMTTVYKAGLVAAVILVFFVGNLYLGGWGLTLALVAGFGAYMLMNRLNIEYEYIFTNGELDIDAIYNKSRRKRLYNGNVKDFEVMAHVEDKNHTGDFNSAQETLNYSSGVITNDTYAFLTAYKGKRVKIIFEPNEMMVKAIATVLTPRKLHRKV
jgi:hypothetical protein